jgi:hypothetical protein
MNPLDVVVAMENEGVVKWGDGDHRARFIDSLYPPKPCLCPKHPGCPKPRRKWRRHCSTCANTCGPFGGSNTR